MASKPKLTVVGGTETPQAEPVKFTSSSSDGALIRTGVYDASGNQYWKSAGSNPKSDGSGSGGGAMSELGEIKARLTGAFAWLGLLTIASGAAFLFIISAIGGVQKDIGGVQSSVAAQSATTTAIQGSITRIEDKLDTVNDHSQTGPGSKPDR